jgi:hypothetical protein
MPGGLPRLAVEIRRFWRDDEAGGGCAASTRPAVAAADDDDDDEHPRVSSPTNAASRAMHATLDGCV